MPIGRKALFGAALGIGAATGFAKGVRGDGELHREFMNLTLGDPDADTAILGTQMTVKNMIAQNIMPFPQYTTRLGRAQMYGRHMASAGGIVGGAAGFGAGSMMGGLPGGIVGAGIGATLGHIGGGLMGALPARRTGFINATTLGDYAKYNRNEMPYHPWSSELQGVQDSLNRMPLVSGDVVLGMHNMRRA